jgi:S1-C subfamily serine protease
VGGCWEAKVSFSDNSSYEAKVVGNDFNSGLALLKIEPIDRKTPVLGDSFSLKHGSWVIVIGNSYDMPNVVNLGVYSGLTDEGFLQLSVQSGPGSSGSAVFNTKGELVGILVAQASETVSFRLPGENDSRISRASDYLPSAAFSAQAFGIELPGSGTNLAIPAARINRVAEQLKKFGLVKHGFLGIRQRPLTDEKLAKLSLKSGVEIIDIVKDSPAEQAGLKTGDILIGIDGTRIKTPGHLYSLVRSHEPGDKIKVEAVRDGEIKKYDVTLDEAPDDGYFGFRKLSKQQFPEMQSDIAKFQEKLADNMRASQEKQFDQRQLEEYIDKLEERVAELEDQLEKISDKLNKLSNELTQ